MIAVYVNLLLAGRFDKYEPPLSGVKKSLQGKVKAEILRRVDSGEITKERAKELLGE